MTLTSKTIRRKQPTAIIHSGGKRTIYSCVCGSQHTCATRHREVKHVADWREEHDETCRELYEQIRNG